MRSFLLASVSGLLLYCLAAPAGADLGPAPRIEAVAAPGFSQPVPLSRYDRAVLQPAGGAVVTFWVDMNSSWLNETERSQMMDYVRSQYSFMGTLVNITTVKPTTGPYHSVTVWPGQDTHTADGTAYGEAWSTRAVIYAGEFTENPARSSWFTNTTARINGIGTTISHEMDHILRGRGHSTNPGDINCSGSLVPPSLRAAGGRTFSDADKAQKIRNATLGRSFLPYNAKDSAGSCNIMGVFGLDPLLDPELSPDNTWVSMWIEVFGPPERFHIGFMTNEGFWDFSEGLDPTGVFSISVPPGVRLDFALHDNFSGGIYPLSLHGDVFVDPASIILPHFSVSPVVMQPYYSGAMLHFQHPDFGMLDAYLRTGAPEGFVVYPKQQGGTDDRGDLGLRPRLFQNHPNPFSTSTEIVFQVPAAGVPDGRLPVRLTVFDIQGRVVSTVLDEPMEPGLHRVTLDASATRSMASGLYFYRLEVAGERLTRRLLLLR